MKEIFYRVTEADSLISICRKFSASIETTIRENALERELEEGDLLLIKRLDNVYVAQVGDTYETVAKKFNVRKDVLIEKNKTEYIFYGYPLII